MDMELTKTLVKACSEAMDGHEARDCYTALLGAMVGLLRSISVPGREALVLGEAAQTLGRLAQSHGTVGGVQ